MPVVYPCPICGRAKGRHGTPFTDPSQTCGHIDGAHDADHMNERGSDYMDDVSENGIEVEDTNEVEGPAPTTPLGAASAGGRSSEPEARPALQEDPIPVTDAVEFHAGIIEEPGAFGLAGEEDVEELRQLVDEQREQIEELHEVIEWTHEMLVEAGAWQRDPGLEWDTFDADDQEDGDAE